VAASITTGRALRYAGGSARGLLHHPMGHCQPIWRNPRRRTPRERPPIHSGHTAIMGS